MHRISVVLSCFALILLAPSLGFACGCIWEGEPLEKYDVAFRGTLMKSANDRPTEVCDVFKCYKGPSTYSVFKVNQVYKGDLGQEFIFHYYKGGMTSCSFDGFQDLGDEYLIFANKNKDGFYLKSPCDRYSRIKKEDLTPLWHPDGEIYINLISDLSDVDSLILREPENLKNYFKKAKIYKKINETSRRN